MLAKEIVEDAYGRRVNAVAGVGPVAEDTDADVVEMADAGRVKVVVGVVAQEASSRTVTIKEPTMNQTTFLFIFDPLLIAN